MSSTKLDGREAGFGSLRGQKSHSSKSKVLLCFCVPVDGVGVRADLVVSDLDVFSDVEGHGVGCVSRKGRGVNDLDSTFGGGL